MVVDTLGCCLCLSLSLILVAAIRLNIHVIRLVALVQRPNPAGSPLLRSAEPVLGCLARATPQRLGGTDARPGCGIGGGGALGVGALDVDRERAAPAPRENDLAAPGGEGVHAAAAVLCGALVAGALAVGVVAACFGRGGAFLHIGQTRWRWWCWCRDAVGLARVVGLGALGAGCERDPQT